MNVSAKVEGLQLKWTSVADLKWSQTVGIHNTIKIASMSIRRKFNGWWRLEVFNSKSSAFDTFRENYRIYCLTQRFSSEIRLQTAWNRWQPIVLASHCWLLAIVLSSKPERYNQLLACGQQTFCSNILITGVSFLQIDDNFSSIYEALCRLR